MRFLKQVLLASKLTTWVLPKWEEEQQEFIRYDDLSPLKNWELLFKRSNRLVSLTDEQWKELENSDSYDVRSLDEAKKIAKKYGRNIHPILKAFETGGTLPAPVIIKWRDGSLELAGGNTRLAAARALGETPKVMIIESDISHSGI